MKQLSYWASRHKQLAIYLIILLEFGKGWIGVQLGFRALPALPGIVIEVAVLAIVLGILLIEGHFLQQVNLSILPKDKYYRLRSRSAFSLFVASFLLALLLGNRCHFFTSGQSGYFTAQAASHRSEIRSVAGSSMAPSVDDHHQDRPLTRRELRRERRLTQQSNRAQQPDPNGPGVGVYILLAVLAFGLAFLGAGLACNLSCSNQGVAAIFVALLAVGALTASIYFVTRAIRRAQANRNRVPAIN